MLRESITVGVLALQGGFSEHAASLKSAFSQIFQLNGFSAKNINVLQVRSPPALQLLDGLIIPGGESTTISIMLQEKDSEFLKALKDFAGKMPVFGTCAGLIMLANEVEGKMATVKQELIGGIDIRVRRNHYGFQAQSFEAVLETEDPELRSDIPMLFIRAPGITHINTDQVKILATYKGSVVAVRENNLMATSFHPELTTATEWHAYFIKMIISNKNNNV